MGKLTISMAIFNSFLYVYQSVNCLEMEHGGNENIWKWWSRHWTLGYSWLDIWWFTGGYQLTKIGTSWDTPLNIAVETMDMEATGKSPTFTDSRIMSPKVEHPGTIVDVGGFMHIWDHLGNVLIFEGWDCSWIIGLVENENLQETIVNYQKIRWFPADFPFIHLWTMYGYLEVPQSWTKRHHRTSLSGMLLLPVRVPGYVPTLGCGNRVASSFLPLVNFTWQGAKQAVSYNFP